MLPRKSRNEIETRAEKDDIFFTLFCREEKLSYDNWDCKLEGKENDIACFNVSCSFSAQKPFKHFSRVSCTCLTPTKNARGSSSMSYTTHETLAWAQLSQPSHVLWGLLWLFRISGHQKLSVTAAWSAAILSMAQKEQRISPVVWYHGGLESQKGLEGPLKKRALSSLLGPVCFLLWHSGVIDSLYTNVEAVANGTSRLPPGRFQDLEFYMLCY